MVIKRRWKTRGKPRVQMSSRLGAQECPQEFFPAAISSEDQAIYNKYIHFPPINYKSLEHHRVLVLLWWHQRHSDGWTPSSVHRFHISQNGWILDHCTKVDDCAPRSLYSGKDLYSGKSLCNLWQWWNFGPQRYFLVSRACMFPRQPLTKAVYNSRQNKAHKLGNYDEL